MFPLLLALVSFCAACLVYGTSNVRTLCQGKAGNQTCDTELSVSLVTLDHMSAVNDTLTQVI